MKKQSIKPLDDRDGMINVTTDMLFRWADIEEAVIKLGVDNHKFFDLLTGFPNGTNKCVGILNKEE